jgi:hypothetical protein
VGQTQVGDDGGIIPPAVVGVLRALAGERLFAGRPNGARLFSLAPNGGAMVKRYCNPTEVITGVGSFAQVGDVVARFGRRALVVRSPHGPQPAPLLEAAEVSLVEGDPITHEPTLDQVESGLALARREKIDVVLGVGGGSPMDAAKAIAGLFPHPGTVQEYHRGARKVPGAGLPFIAVPTTAGTGAEVTKNAVLTDPSRHVKASIRHDGWFARVAVVDPELTYSLPPGVTAASGSDALCQAIEAYVSIGAITTPATPRPAPICSTEVSWPGWPCLTRAWAGCTAWLTRWGIASTSRTALSAGYCSPL